MHTRGKEQVDSVALQPAGQAAGLTVKGKTQYRATTPIHAYRDYVTFRIARDHGKPDLGQFTIGKYEVGWRRWDGDEIKTISVDRLIEFLEAS